MPTCSARAATIEIAVLEQPAAAPLELDRTYLDSCPLGQLTAGSASTNVPAPREPGAPGPGEEISDLPAQCHGPDAAVLLEAPRRCACGCGTPVAIVQMTDRRSGSRRGEPRRFVRGHAARLRQRREFADLEPESFWSEIDKNTGTGCWLAPRIQISLGGLRVYSFRVALLLDRGLPVTAEALAGIRLRRRCGRHRRCVHADHAALLVRCESENMRRADAIAAARARLAAGHPAAALTLLEPAAIRPPEPWRTSSSADR